ncbi:MAG: F-type H+-transporting ATPase subunit delta [Bacteroidota bacterium]|nr:F-type H+-transporting ATPase subunit delta [Bacteroidota bacterium]
MTEQRVSSRYARAILETAEQEGFTETVLADFKVIEKIVEASRELENLMKSPIVRYWRKKQVFNEIFQPRVSKLTMSFINLLTSKNREVLIPSIVIQFIKQYNILRGLLPVEINSAVEMDDDLKQTVKSKLELYTQKKVLPSYRTDSLLKGGLTVRIDDWVFDGSLRNQLEIMFKKMVAGEAV